MFEKYLRDIGLSDKEAAVYIALLGFDKAKIAQISEKAKVKRPTTYVILESLATKGLVSEFNADKKTYYIAEPPEKLEHFVERQIQNLEEHKKSLDLIVPQLRSIQHEGSERPVVQFFEGKEGVLSAHSGTFAKKIGNEPVYMIYPRDLVSGIFNEKETSVLREQRLKLGVKSKAVYTSTVGERPSDETGERMIIDSKKYPIECDITVYGEKIRITVLGKHVSGIYIDSKEFAETLKSMVRYILEHP